MKYYQILLLVTIALIKVFVTLHLFGHDVEKWALVTVSVLAFISVATGVKEKFTKKVEF